MNLAEIKRPPQFEFAGHITRDEQILVESHIRSIQAQADKTLPPQIKHTQTRKRNLLQMVYSLGEFALNELGVDLYHRLPLTNRFHFLDQDSLSIAAAEDVSASKTRGFHKLDVGMVILEHSDELRTLAAANHELIHACAHSRLRVSKGSEDSLHYSFNRAGFNNLHTKSFKYFSEALTELTNIDIMLNFWPQYDLKVTYGPVKPGYTDHIIFTDHLIRKISQEAKLPYLQVLRTFQRSLFTGEIDPLLLVKQFLGRDALYQLSSLPYESQDLDQVAAKFGINQYTETINAENLNGLILNYKR